MTVRGQSCEVASRQEIHAAAGEARGRFASRGPELRARSLLLLPDPLLCRILPRMAVHMLTYPSHVEL